MCGMDAQSGKYQNLSIYSKPSSVIVLELGITVLTVISSCGYSDGNHTLSISNTWSMCGMDNQSGRYQDLSIYSRTSSVIVLELVITVLTVISSCRNLV